MPQTEDMKRLLKDGKIVGFMWVINGHVYFSFGSVMPKPEMCAGYEKDWWLENPMFDAFEQGIQVGEDWWFEGDKIEFKYARKWVSTTLTYNEHGGIWMVGGKDYWQIRSRHPKRIGNIHEEAK